MEERKMKKERKIHTGVEKYIISVMLICSSPLTVFKILALHNLVRNLQTVCSVKPFCRNKNIKLNLTVNNMNKLRVSIMGSNCIQ